MRKIVNFNLAAFIFVAACGPVIASDTDVLNVKVEQESTKFRFDVTLRHDDKGWDNYANVWEVVGPDGTVLATRILMHPHVNEQPFTRSLGGIEIPATISQVTVRAGDNVDGIGGKTMVVKLPGRN